MAAEMKPWADCPMCRGAGAKWRFWFDDSSWVEPTTGQHPPANYARKSAEPCPTCEAFHRGVDAAVKAEREHCIDAARELIEYAYIEEREACAKVAQNWTYTQEGGRNWSDWRQVWNDGIASAIRARTGGTDAK